MSISILAFFFFKAAHCFNFDAPVRALLGHANISDPNKREISNVIKHPDYKKTVVYLDGTQAKSDADIAVLILKEAVVFTDYIQPICLPGSSINTFSIDGSVAGYGITNITKKEASEVSKYVSMKTVDLQTCFASNSQQAAISVSLRSFCAKGDGAPCHGNLFYV